MTEPLTDFDRAGDDQCPQCGHEVSDAWLVCAWCGQQLAAAAELAEGTRLADGRYQILRVIGRGGFGITYDVGDRRLERRVAMKELFPESAVRHGSMVLTPPQGRPAFKDARERFLREARVLARFTHPGIVRVFEVFEEHGTAYLVMELLEGRTLIQLLQQHGRPFSEADLLDVTGRVAAALRPVHSAGVLHRDINPSNVMMTHHGRIVVIDFGLARDYDQGHSVGMTRMVTPGYAPLEQYRGEGRFGPTTDVYGLAATCYRLATGKVPVSALERDGGVELPAPHRINPAISKEVSDAILDGLELEPSHRPQDIDSLLSRLGIRRLPTGARATLLDTVPVPSGEPPLSAAEVVPPLSVDVPARPISSRTGPTVIEPRRPTADADLTMGDITRGPAGDTQVAFAPDQTVGPDDGRTVIGAFDAVSGPTGTPDGYEPPAVHDGGYGPSPRAHLPIAVGPHPSGRWKLTVPLLAVALAAGAAAPVLGAAVLILVMLPALATAGDTAAHRMRAEYGIEGGWAERRMAPGTLAPMRFFRNVVASVLRASPLIGVGAVLLAAWYGLDHMAVSRNLLHVTLRGVGLFIVGLAAYTARGGSSRFRTGLGIDEMVQRWVPDGRTTERVVILWLVAGALVAGSLWLTPAPFPLP